MRFAIVGEGLTDYWVLRNLLYGFFKNKNLPVNRLRPRETEPGGWSNLLDYIVTEDFRIAFEFNDYIIVQIDTNECADWNKDVAHIGDNEDAVGAFIEKVRTILVERIGADFYDEHKSQIIFAICVHEIECWLLPFNATQAAHVKKMVGCFGTLEKICVKQGFSLNEKNYQEGKHYDDLSKEMKDPKVLIKKGTLNPSLKVFLQNLSAVEVGGVNNDPPKDLPM